jgi:hypothetical protein
MNSRFTGMLKEGSSKQNRPIPGIIHNVTLTFLAGHRSGVLKSIPAVHFYPKRQSINGLCLCSIKQDDRQPDWALPSGDQEISRLEKGFWGGDKSTPEVEMGASGVENDNSPAIYGWDACARPAFESRKDERPVLPSLPGLDVDWERQTQP